MSDLFIGLSGNTHGLIRYMFIYLNTTSDALYLLIRNSTKYHPFKNVAWLYDMDDNILKNSIAELASCVTIETSFICDVIFQSVIQAMNGHVK